MDATLTYIIICCLLSGAGSVLLASFVLIVPQKRRDALMPCLLSYATGTLLGAALLGLFHQSASRIGFREASYSFLAGIVLFFVLEKLLIWRHCHDEQCSSHSASGPLILFGDALHNFIDGVVLASAFSVSHALGLATSIAIIGHEIPQELGDFAVLLESGYSKSKALLYNVLSSTTTLIAGIGSYFFLKETTWVLPYVMSLAAASFVYIAIADLVPTLHRRVGLRSLMVQTALILAGVTTITIVSESLH
jgi:zinc and cadmium transporter